MDALMPSGRDTGAPVLPRQQAAAPVRPRVAAGLHPEQIVRIDRLCSRVREMLDNDRGRDVRVM